jgi:hypothetical protein
MYDKAMVIGENGTITRIDEAMVSITMRAFDQLVRTAERVETIQRMYHDNKGILCTSDVVAILGIEKYKEENEDA